MSRRDLGTWATRGRRRRFGWAIAVVVAVAVTSAAYGATQNASWLTGGQNLENSRYQANESAIGTGNVGTLAPKSGFAGGGAFVTPGFADVSATPAVDGQRIYFPDSAGKLWALDRSTGAVAWSVDVSDYTLINEAHGAVNTFNGNPDHDYARATPAISGNTLILGTQSGKFETPEWADDHPELKGAWILAIDKNTGALLWKTRVHDHFAAFITQSAQVNGNTAYVGVASNEEAFSNQDLAAGHPYTCCTFRGKFVALDVKTGAIKWETYTVPAIAGYSGNAVWGSTPAIDPQRGAVYITTGNNYSLPADRIECVDDATTFEAKQACLPGDNFDAIMSLNMQTGAINWSYRALASDAWNTDCGLPGFSEGGTNPGNCPTDAGPDYDFGQGPMLLTAKVNGKTTDIVGAGEKSGDFSAVDRNTGALLWKTHVGPGGLTGGLQWGSATDGKRIYVAESNSANLDVKGYWSALDPSTGAELWRTSDPGTGIGGRPCTILGIDPFPGCTLAMIGIGFGYSAEGPVSVANGVVYACSLNPAGPNMVAMDAATGAIKWTYPSGSSCLGGAAIANGTVYWGTGYRSFFPLTTAGNKLFAFTPNGS
jgi:polyvinyl alcohol dehydrogenase (cytochrome)